MAITSKPIFDCLSCDAFMPDTRPNAGYCRRNPPSAQITSVDKFGAPQIMSMFPPVQKGMFCLQHPMAKAFPPGEFAPRAFGQAEPINGKGVSDPEEPVDDEPLSGEIKPEAAN